MPSHKHDITSNWGRDSGGSGWGAQISNYSSGYILSPNNIPSYMSNTGGNNAHNNLQPYLCVYIFKRTA